MNRWYFGPQFLVLNAQDLHRAKKRPKAIGLDNHKNTRNSTHRSAIVEPASCRGPVSEGKEPPLARLHDAVSAVSMSAANAPNEWRHDFKPRMDKTSRPFWTRLRIHEVTRLVDCPQVLLCALVRAQYCRPFRLLQAGPVQITTLCVFLVSDMRPMLQSFIWPVSTRIALLRCMVLQHSASLPDSRNLS